MAYDPTIPALENYIGDDIPKITANFAELADSRVVEMGSNSNGEYVRWENGLQVCWWRESVAHNHPNALGPIYRSDDIIWTYPASFVSNPFVVASASNSAWASVRTLGLSSSNLISFSPDSSSRVAYIIAVAIGRWK